MHLPLFLLILILSTAFHAQALESARSEQARTILHLLDYIGVDYGGAVQNGKVAKAGEYEEMAEFAKQVEAQLTSLPDNPAKASLIRDARELKRQMGQKVDPAAVAAASSKLRWELISAYGLQVAPRNMPRLGSAAKLYAQNCVVCHGVQGKGDGTAAKGMDPAPSNFHDAERMANRSAYGLYNTISLGVGGTAMTPFKQLSDDDRWVLAYYVANLGETSARIAEGERLWKSGELRAEFAGGTKVATLSPNEARALLGERAVAVQSYLRANPQAVEASRPDPLAYARQKLAESLNDYRAGRKAEAHQAAITSYLEGFELIEGTLDNVDSDLRAKIEQEMMGMRNAINSNIQLDELANRIARIDALLVTAASKLNSGDLSPSAAFSSAFIILIREGLEAIFLIAAIIAFITKSGRKDALRYVHVGWIGALALGLLTWVAATYFISISGANREMTEGVTALVAAAMLLYVGYWLHGRGQARAWSKFLREQVGAALQKKTLWAMALVSFIAVYREMFEVVLFYQALWVQAAGGHSPIISGIVTAAATLVILGWGIFKYSVRLPLGPFFRTMSALMVVMAVAFAGQGVADLQEAGVVSATPVQFVTLPLLGVHPTIQTLGAQFGALLLVFAGYLWTKGHRVRDYQKRP